MIKVGSIALVRKDLATGIGYGWTDDMLLLAGSVVTITKIHKTVCQVAGSDKWWSFKCFVPRDSLKELVTTIESESAFFSN